MRPLQKDTINADDRQDQFTWPGPREILSQAGALRGKLEFEPLQPSPPTTILHTTSLLAGMQGPMPEGPARQEARRHRWFSEAIPGLQQAQQSWGLLLVTAPLLAWVVAQTLRQLGGGRPGDAEVGGAVASPFGTSILLPWVSTLFNMQPKGG